MTFISADHPFSGCYSRAATVVRTQVAISLLHPSAESAEMISHPALCRFLLISAGFAKRGVGLLRLFKVGVTYSNVTVSLAGVF